MHELFEAQLLKHYFLEWKLKSHTTRLQSPNFNWKCKCLKAVGYSQTASNKKHGSIMKYVALLFSIN